MAAQGLSQSKQDSRLVRTLAGEMCFVFLTLGHNANFRAYLARWKNSSQYFTGVELLEMKIAEKWISFLLEKKSLSIQIHARAKESTGKKRQSPLAI